MSCRLCTTPGSAGGRLAHVLRVGQQRAAAVGVRLILDNEDAECAICLNPIIVNDSDARIANLDDAELAYAARRLESLSCGHVFHTKCLQESFAGIAESRWTCPVDRQSLIQADVAHLRSATTPETRGRLNRLTALRQEMRQKAAREKDDAGRLARLEAEAAQRAEADRAAAEWELAEDNDEDFFYRLEGMLLDAKDREKKARKRAASKEKKKAKRLEGAAGGEGQTEDDFPISRRLIHNEFKDLVVSDSRSEAMQVLIYCANVSKAISMNIIPPAEVPDVTLTAKTSATDSKIRVYSKKDSPTPAIIFYLDYRRCNILYDPTLQPNIAIEIAQAMAIMSRMVFTFRFDPLPFQGPLPLPLMFGFVPNAFFSKQTSVPEMLDALNSLFLTTNANARTSISPPETFRFAMGALGWSVDALNEFKYPIIRSGNGAMLAFALKKGKQFDKEFVPKRISGKNMTVVLFQSSPGFSDMFKKISSVLQKPNAQSVTVSGSPTSATITMLSDLRFLYTPIYNDSVSEFFAAQINLLDGTLLCTIERRQQNSYPVATISNKELLALYSIRAVSHGLGVPIVVKKKDGQEFQSVSVTDLMHQFQGSLPSPLAYSYYSMALNNRDDYSATEERHVVLLNQIPRTSTFRNAVNAVSLFAMGSEADPDLINSFIFYPKATEDAHLVESMVVEGLDYPRWPAPS